MRRRRLSNTAHTTNTVVHTIFHRTCRALRKDEARGEPRRIRIVSARGARRVPVPALVANQSIKYKKKVFHTHEAKSTHGQVEATSQHHLRAQQSPCVTSRSDTGSGGLCMSRNSSTQHAQFVVSRAASNPLYLYTYEHLARRCVHKKYTTPAHLLLT